MSAAHVDPQAESPPGPEPESTAALDRRQDPYLAWALLTQYRYLVREFADNPKGPIRLAGVLRHKGKLGDAKSAVESADACLIAEPILKTRYFSGVMTTHNDEAFLKLQDYADFVLAEPGMWPAGAGRPGEWGMQVAGKSEPRAKKCSQSVVIGVIDGLCGFANECFCPDDFSALDFFWDQAGNSKADARWARADGFGYGRQLSRAELDKIAKDLPKSKNSTGERIEAEKALYRALGQAVPDDADWSHGTHVLHTVLSDLVDPRTGQALEEQPGVVYVQLPGPALRDTSGRWAAAYVLDAIAYVLSHAKETAKVVINLSLGSFAGPHDGSSILERAIDELAHRHSDRLTFVVAAGNAGQVVDDGTGVHKACHARFTLDPGTGPEFSQSGRSVSLDWDIDVPDDTESFMEIWVPKLGLAGKSCGVAVSLSHPAKELTTGNVDPDKTKTIKQDGKVLAMVANATGKCKAPNGSGGMVLVALGHTRDPAGGASAPTGRWVVKVTNTCARPLTIDAWIERRDIPGELRGFRPQYGFARRKDVAASKGGLGTLANGRETIVVGALKQKEQSKTYTYSASAYSSTGIEASLDECNPRVVLRRGPDVYAAGERRASGHFSGSFKTLAGTSIAAAQVTAAVACVAKRRDKASMLDALASFARERQDIPRQGVAGRGPGGSSSPVADPESTQSLFVLPPRDEEAEAALRQASQALDPSIHPMDALSSVDARVASEPAPISYVDNDVEFVAAAAPRIDKPSSPLIPPN
jgi:hypothetical protein